MTYVTVARGALICALLGSLAACGGSGTDSSSANASSSTSGSTTSAASGPALVALSASSYSFPASIAAATVTIERAGGSAGVATASYATADGTAAAGTDYVATSGTVTWADGDSTPKSVVVPVSVSAAGKRFALGLTAVAGAATIGAPASATIAVGSGTGGASGGAGAVSVHPSANGTWIVTGGVLIDSSLNQWTIVNAAAYKGTAKAGYSSNVAVLLYYDGTIYQQNTSCQWWYWSGSAWVATNDPDSRVSTAQCPVASTSGVAGALSIKAQGNQLVDGNGLVVQLRGADISGLESLNLAPTNNYWKGANLGTFPFFGPILSWKMNAVRIPLNEATWLRYKGVDVMNLRAGTQQPDASGNYQAAVKQTVLAANAAGLYVILDLHWTAPGNYLADTQDQLPDSDHSVEFWSSLAQAFGNNPAVIFDLFNEPYPTAVGGQNEYEVELNGATQTAIDYNSGKSSIKYTWTSVGMQGLVNTVRAAGAINLLMIGGASGAMDLSGFTTAGGGYFPSDPLHNIAASWHAYGVDSASFTTKNANWSANINPTEVASQILAQGIPIIIGEVGDRSSNGTTSAPKISYITSWADAHGASVLPWTWDVWSATGGTENLLIKDQYGTPTDGEGVTYKDWLAQH